MSNHLRLMFSWSLALSICCSATLAQQPAGEQEPDAADEVTVIENPTLRAVLEAPRETPADYARAIFLLVDLGETERALALVDELLALNLDDATRAALVEQFGSARFMRLTLAAGSRSPAANFAAACLASAGAKAVDPGRLEELIKQLGSESVESRSAALLQLRRTGQAGVSYCLRQIAKTKDVDRNLLREALVALAPTSRPALLAMLDSADADLRKQAAWALGKLDNGGAAPLLAAQAILEPAGSDAGRAAQWALVQVDGQPASSSTATRLLDKALREVRRGVPIATPDADGAVVVYQRRSDQPLALEPLNLPVADAGVIRAARLARLRLRVDPSQRTMLRRALVLDLEARSLLEAVGVTPPLDDLLLPTQQPNEVLNAALAEALDSQFPGAATALCVVLGDRGDAAVLATGDGRASPLANALEAPHPAVRFAALRAVMGLKPTTPFPGSSRVPDVLLEFADGGKSRAAVVAMPNLDRSATLAGYLASLGIEGRAAGRGEDAIELAAQADVEMVVVDLGILRPGVRETVFRLRRQASTGLAPIALLAADGRLADAQALAAEHRRVFAFSRPHNADSVAAIVESLTRATPAGWPTTTERAELAQVARRWLSELLAASLETQTQSASFTFYNLRSRRGEIERVLGEAGAQADSIEGLASLGTPESQVELLLLVHAGATPITERRAAAIAFTSSVNRFGVLLTTDQITEQYDLYNASETSDEQTQNVLGSVLDAIESKRKSKQQAAGSRP